MGNLSYLKDSYINIDEEYLELKYGLISHFKVPLEQIREVTIGRDEKAKNLTKLNTHNTLIFFNSPVKINRIIKDEFLSMGCSFLKDSDFDILKKEIGRKMD